MTQAQAVYNYMKENGGITQMQANYELGVSRLSGVIYNLKEQLLNEGNKEKIVDEWLIVKSRYGKTEVKKYKLEENENEI